MPHCRCSNCGRRQTLTKHPEEYTRKHFASCRFCKKAPIVYVDHYRDSGKERKRQGKPCNCLGYSFPHRKGSGWCEMGGPLYVNQGERENWS